MSKRTKTLTPTILRKMIQEEKAKIIKEAKEKAVGKGMTDKGGNKGKPGDVWSGGEGHRGKPKKTGMLDKGPNKYDPWSKSDTTADMTKVEADGWAKTSKLVNASKVLKEEEIKLKKRMQKIQELKAQVRKQLLRSI